MTLLSDVPVPGFSSEDLRMIFPGVLLLYYFITWLLVGRDPKIETVTPQYQPPEGVSPGVARYITTGGSDGTTLAAVLTQLAAKGVVSIQPEGHTYQVQLLGEQSHKHTRPPAPRPSASRILHTAPSSLPATNPAPSR